MFETLTEFAASNQFGVTLDKDGWSFRVKDWKVILPQLVMSQLTLLIDLVKSERSFENRSCQEIQYLALKIGYGCKIANVRTYILSC